MYILYNFAKKKKEKMKAVCTRITFITLLSAKSNKGNYFYDNLKILKYTT